MPEPRVIDVARQRAPFRIRPHQTPPSPRSPLAQEFTDDYVGRESHGDIFKVGCVLHGSPGQQASSSGSRRDSQCTHVFHYTPNELWDIQRSIYIILCCMPPSPTCIKPTTVISASTYLHNNLQHTKIPTLQSPHLISNLRPIPHIYSIKHRSPPSYIKTTPKYLLPHTYSIPIHLNLLFRHPPQCVCESSNATLYANASISHTGLTNVQHTAVEATWSRTRQYWLATPAHHTQTCGFLLVTTTIDVCPFQSRPRASAAAEVPVKESAAGPSTQARIFNSRVAGNQLPQTSSRTPALGPVEQNPRETTVQDEHRKIGAKNRLLLTEGNISVYYRNYE